jgi:hypothetical protein
MRCSTGEKANRLYSIEAVEIEVPAWSSAEAELGSGSDTKFAFRGSAPTAHAGFVKLSELLPGSIKIAPPAGEAKSHATSFQGNDGKPLASSQNPQAGGIDPTQKIAYERVINENHSTLGKYLADQSRAFGEAAEAGDRGNGSESGEGTSSSSPGRNVEAWARAEGKLVPEGEIEALPVLSDSTSEHVVYLRLGDKRVVKRTRELYYGQVPELVDGKIVSESASPSGYLRRMALQTAVFHSDIRLEGISVPKESLFLDNPADAPYIVTSQPWFESEGTVTFHEVEDFLSKEGFAPIPNSFYGWIRPADGVVILDAAPDNFIMTSEGLVPIDLQMNVFSHAQMKEAGLIKD